MATVSNVALTSDLRVTWLTPTAGVWKFRMRLLRVNESGVFDMSEPAVSDSEVDSTISGTLTHGFNYNLQSLPLISGYYRVSIGYGAEAIVLSNTITYDDGSNKVTAVQLAVVAGKLTVTWQNSVPPADLGPEFEDLMKETYTLRLYNAAGAVVLGTQQTVSAMGGTHTYTFEDLPSGTYKAGVFAHAAAAFEPFSASLVYTKPVPPVVVTVVDQVTSAPAQGVAVVDAGGNPLGTTDAQGKLTLGPPLPDNARVMIAKAGYTSQHITVGTAKAGPVKLPKAPDKPKAPAAPTPAPAAPQTPAVSGLNAKGLLHNKSMVPVCRVHVYQNSPTLSKRANAAMPRHWCGPYALAPGNAPHCVIGQGGEYLFHAPRQGKRKTMEWEVLSCRVNETRQWSCSSAQFQIARPMDAISLPQAPPVRPNDIIVVEIGYIKALDVDVTLKTGATDYTVFAGDVAFYGKVDDVKERGGSGDKDGIVFTVVARDMMSHLVDNKIRGHYLPPTTADGYNRAYVIRDLILRGAAIDYVQWGEPDEKGKVEPIRDPARPELVLAAKFSPDNCYVEMGRLEMSQREDVQPPSTQNNSGILLMDKFPLDVIKHFSLVETAPRELYADRRTGFLHWVFRRSDARRLYDAATRHFRQYFYRYPANRANIISYTNEWSTAGTVSHFTISNPVSSAAGEKRTSELYATSPMAALKDPHTGELLRPFTRNRFVYDDTLLEEDPISVVADALFAIWGRAIETGMVMVPGDPTLEIGEAIQLFNTGLFGRRYWPGRTDAKGRQYSQSTQGTTFNGAEQVAYADLEYNPEGVYRVEALTHLFAVGGVSRGYTTVFVFGPVDTDTGGATLSNGKVTPSRLIKSQADIDSIELVGVKDHLIL